MARSIALLVTLVAVAHAGFVYVEDNDDIFSSPFKMLSGFRLPGFPQGFPFGGMRLPKLPTPSDIMNTKPKANQMFQGAMARSSSRVTTDKDGKPVMTGGSVVVLNNNGKVEKFETGNNPPNPNDPVFPFAF